MQPRQGFVGKRAAIPAEAGEAHGQARLRAFGRGSGECELDVDPRVDELPGDEAWRLPLEKDDRAGDVQLRPDQDVRGSAAPDPPARARRQPAAVRLDPVEPRPPVAEPVWLGEKTPDV